MHLAERALDDLERALERQPDERFAQWVVRAAEDDLK